MEGWGKHLVIDARACDITKATDPQYIYNFTKDLVKLIDMKPFGEPQVVHFDGGSGKAGWTVMQFIETSNITGHFLDNNGDLYLDVFSCKEYDIDTVIKYLFTQFKPEAIRYEVLVRDARTNGELNKA